MLAPVRLPAGTRSVEGRFLLTRGLAETTQYLDRQLSKAGLSFVRVGPYRVRAVEVTRFLSQQPSTQWLAIHVVRKDGQTFLDIVERTSNQGTP